MRLQTGPLAIAPLWMITNKAIPAGALRLWMYLHAVYTHRTADLSRSDMASLMDVTVETIDRWLKSLVDEGCLIVTKQRSANNAWLPNEYELCMVQGSHMDMGRYPDKIPLPPPKKAPQRTNRSRARQSGVIYRDSTSTVLEVKHTTHPYFHEWYHLYRRKAKKQAALKAWDKLGLETDDALRELVMQGTRRYLEYWKAHATDMRYIPHPSTWLNNRQWEDDVSTTAPVPLSKQTQRIQSASQQFLERHTDD